MMVTLNMVKLPFNTKITIRYTHFSKLILYLKYYTIILL
jgi:hypothetical protein